MLLLQNILYCLLFILMVKCLVRNDGMNCVYFYPKEYIEEADKRGLIDKDAVMKKGKHDRRKTDGASDPANGQ